MAWYDQVCMAVNYMKENVILAIIDFIANDDLVKRSAEKKHSRKVKVHA